MLAQLISRTPVWVWALLVFLLYRGVKASQDRELGLRAMLVIPCVMLFLSVQGMFQHFGFAPIPFSIWALCLMITAGVAAHFTSAGSFRIISPTHLWVRGSWLPLILMLLIFIVKYAENVAVAIQPALRTETAFVLICSAVFGVMNGLFFGKLVRLRQLLSKGSKSSEWQTTGI